MGGLRRVKAQTIEPDMQQSYTCTTVGCPDPAVVVIPLNQKVLSRPLVDHHYSTCVEEARSHDGDGSYDLKLCLCRRCVRVLATALPPGMRLAGAVLRYPECAPEVLSTEAVEKRYHRVS